MTDYKKMKEQSYVENQYATTDKLQQRIDFHNRYSTNKQGYYPWLFEQCVFEEGMTILELGSGKGDIWADHMSAVSANMTVVLSDFSEAMVRTLKDRFKVCRVTVKQIDIESIPYEAEQFDVVIANAMLYHVPNLDQGLKEVARVLKTGGTFYASTFGTDGFMNFMTKSLEFVGIQTSTNANTSFTLENGGDILGQYFRQIDRRLYDDQLVITDTDDLIAYICSTNMYDLLDDQYQQRLKQYFEAMKDEADRLVIRKSYGTFVTQK